MQTANLTLQKQEEMHTAQINDVSDAMKSKILFKF